MAKRGLTAQQLKLIDGYVQHGNQKKAALDAGYSAESAANIYRTFRLSWVKEEIQRRLDEEMTSREVLHRLGRHAREGEPTVAVKALELLGKKHKLFTDKVEATGAVTINLVDPYAQPKEHGR